MSAAHHRAAEGTDGLFADVLSAATRLLRGEIALARAEAEQRARSLARAMVQCVVAVVLGITAMNVLAGAGVAALVAYGQSPTVAALIVAVVLLALAFGFGRWAMWLLSPDRLTMHRTMTSLGRDVAALKSMVKSDDTPKSF